MKQTAISLKTDFYGRWDDQIKVLKYFYNLVSDQTACDFLHTCMRGLGLLPREVMVVWWII